MEMLPCTREILPTPRREHPPLASNQALPTQQRVRRTGADGASGPNAGQEPCPVLLGSPFSFNFSHTV